MATTYDGINYFPVSVNFMEENAMEVIEVKYGIKGLAIVLKQGRKRGASRRGEGNHQDSVHQRDTGRKQLSGKRNTNFGKHTKGMAGSYEAKEKRTVGAPLSDSKTGKGKRKTRCSFYATGNSATRAVQRGKNTC